MASFWLTGLSSASRMRKGPAAACTARHLIGVAGGRPSTRATERRPCWIEQVRLLDRLGIRIAAMPSSRQAMFRISPAGSRLTGGAGDQHPMRRFAAQGRGFRLLGSARVKPSISGMWASSSTRGTGSPALPRLCTRVEPAPPAPSDGQFEPACRQLVEHLVEDAAGWWRCRRPPAPAGRPEWLEVRAASTCRTLSAGRSGP